MVDRQISILSIHFLTLQPTPMLAPCFPHFSYKFALKVDASIQNPGFSPVFALVVRYVDIFPVSDVPAHPSTGGSFCKHQTSGALADNKKKLNSTPKRAMPSNVDRT